MDQSLPVTSLSRASRQTDGAGEHSLWPVSTPALSFGSSCRLRRIENPLPVYQFPRSFRLANTQQARKKLARAKVRCDCRVMSFPKFHYNDLLPIVADLLATRRSTLTCQDSLPCR